MRANRGSDFSNFSPRVPLSLSFLPCPALPCTALSRVRPFVLCRVLFHVCVRVCNQAVAQEPHSFSIVIVLPRIDCDIK